MQHFAVSREVIQLADGRQKHTVALSGMTSCLKVIQSHRYPCPEGGGFHPSYSMAAADVQQQWKAGEAQFAHSGRQDYAGSD